MPKIFVPIASYSKMKKLRSMFCNNGYPNYFFDKVLYQFMSSRQTNLNQMQPTNKKEKETITLEIPNVGNSLPYSPKTF